MTLDELKTNLFLAECELHKHYGFTREQTAVAVAMAKHAGSSVLPLQVLAEWLRRNPEAVDVLKAILEPKSVGEWTVAATFQTISENAAQSSEPHPLDVLRERAEAAEKRQGPRPGVKGAGAASISVDVSNAPVALDRTAVRTRTIKPDDVTGENGLGEGVKIRGMDAVTGADGKPLIARVRFHKDRVRLVEFLDKRGPVILTRLATGDDKGTVVNVPIEYVEPCSRRAVLAALAKMPGANVQTDFSPFDGARDPWNGELIGAPEPADDGPKPETFPTFEPENPPTIETPLNDPLAGEDAGYSERDHS